MTLTDYLNQKPVQRLPKGSILVTKDDCQLIHTGYTKQYVSAKGKMMFVNNYLCRVKTNLNKKDAFSCAYSIEPFTNILFVTDGDGNRQLPSIFKFENSIDWETGPPQLDYDPHV
jgi:hypothetical protein